MAALDGDPYTMFSRSLARGLVDLLNDDLRLMLLSDYTVGTTRDDAQFLADVLAVATEVSGTGYTAGGQAVPSPTLDESGHIEVLDTDTNFVWTGADFTFRWGVLYDRTPSTDATRPVIGFYDAGEDKVVSGTLTLTINTSGLLTLTGV